MSVHVEDLLYAMRTGEPQPDAAIEAFVRGVTDETISRPQAGAWLAWAFQRGLTGPETLALTRAMTHSGDILAWPEGPTLIDKHSTGGVGDNVSLVLAPLWAELGYRVPMISGRGLGHTGGTLDKLESIPGYRCDLEIDALGEQLQSIGCFINGQTAELAPADRILYGLRNETCTVESIPLIVGSILSKKLAEGVDQLVFDVKTGSGAFMKTREDSQRLAETLVSVAEGSGVRCTALISAMDRPLGRMVGNALEVREAIACLRGEGPDDLRDLTVALARDPRAAEVLASGAALDRFRRMIEAQGGEPRVVDDPDLLLGGGTRQITLHAGRSGFVTQVDAFKVGRAAFVLGAGRRRAQDPVDFGVGIEVLVSQGEQVQEGQPLAVLHHRERDLDRAERELTSAFQIEDAPVTPPPLVQAVIGA